MRWLPGCDRVTVCRTSPLPGVSTRPGVRFESLIVRDPPARSCPGNGVSGQHMPHRGDSRRLAEGFKAYLWPRKGFHRGWRYRCIRLARMDASPHRIAAGFASGAAVSVTPLLGFHALLACLLAFLTRGSILAALLGTVVGNPLTFPLFFAGTYWLGVRLGALATADSLDDMERLVEELNETAEAEAAADAVIDAAGRLIDGGWSIASVELLWPTVSAMLIGSALLVPVAYGIFYGLARLVVRAFGRRSARRRFKGSAAS